MNASGDTIISIDYGRRRIGLARSDPTGTIATALDTLQVKSDNDALKQVAAVIDEHRPQALVIGYPLNEDGSAGDACKRVDRFVEKLKTVFTGPIHRIDEYGTSEEAADIIHAHGQRVGKDKKRVDRLAAVIILRRFLDER